MTQKDNKPDDTELIRSLLRTGIHISPGTYTIRERIDLGKRPIAFKEGLPIFLFGIAVGITFMAMMS